MLSEIIRRSLAEDTSPSDVALLRGVATTARVYTVTVVGSTPASARGRRSKKIKWACQDWPPGDHRLTARLALVKQKAQSRWVEHNRSILNEFLFVSLFLWMSLFIIQVDSRTHIAVGFERTSVIATRSRSESEWLLRNIFHQNCVWPMRENKPSRQTIHGDVCNIFF